MVAYPKKWSIDEKEDLFGKVNGWATVGFDIISIYASLLAPISSGSEKNEVEIERGS